MPFTILSQYIRSMRFDLGPKVKIHEEKEPKVTLNLEMENQYHPGGASSLLLNISAEAKRDEDAIYNLQVSYGCFLETKLEEDEDINHIFLVAVPNYLYPFVRQLIYQLTSQAGVPPLFLKIVNFEELFNELRRNKTYQLPQ